MNLKTEKPSNKLALTVFAIFLGFSILYPLIVQLPTLQRVLNIHFPTLNRLYAEYYVDEILSIVVFNLFILLCFKAKDKYGLKFNMKSGIGRFILGLLPAVLFVFASVFVYDFSYLDPNTLLSYGFRAYQAFKFFVYYIALFAIMYLICIFLIPKAVEASIRNKWLSIILQILSGAAALTIMSMAMWVEFNVADVTDRFIFGLLFAYTAVVTKSHAIGILIFEYMMVIPFAYYITYFRMKYFIFYLIALILTVIYIAITGMAKRRLSDTRY